MLKKLKQLFCRHEWECKPTGGFRIDKDGWYVTAYVYTCRKCGKKTYKDPGR